MDTIVDFFKSPETQWLSVCSAGAYAGLFAWLRIHQTELKDRVELLRLSLFLLFIGIVITFYISNYTVTSETLDTLALLVGIAIGQLVGYSQQIAEAKGKLRTLRLCFQWSLIVLPIILAFFPEPAAQFHYRGVRRWTGPWVSPNTFGLVMGIGLLSTVGLILSRRGAGKRYSNFLDHLIAICLWIALGWFGISLLKSYSRGAWFATIVGILLMAWRGRIVIIRHPAVSFLLNTRSNQTKRAILLIAVFVTVIALFAFRHTEQGMLRRVMSAVNANDFSWRNRVAAYKGGIQVIADNPLFGTSERPLALYEHFYQPERVSESMAIQSNSYILVAATSGTLALLCFFMCLWLSFRGSVADGDMTMSEDSREEWLAVSNQAAAVCLLIGFWFSPGLFNITLSICFWMLLEFQMRFLTKQRPKALNQLAL